MWFIIFQFVLNASLKSSMPSHERNDQGGNTDTRNHLKKTLTHTKKKGKKNTDTTSKKHLHT